MIERTRTYCHGCGEYFIAELDMELNGNHEIPCPHCGHIHYRVIEEGKVTGDRYRSSMDMYNASTYVATTAVISGTSGTAYNQWSMGQSWSNSYNLDSTSAASWS